MGGGVRQILILADIGGRVGFMTQRIIIFSWKVSSIYKTLIVLFIVDPDAPRL